jgi:hypothetical protein
LHILRHRDNKGIQDIPGPHEVSASQIQIEQEMMLFMTENGIFENLDFPSIIDRHEDIEIVYSRTLIGYTRIHSLVIKAGKIL